VPNGTSQDIIDTYIDAFSKVTSDSSFAAKSAKRLGIYSQQTGKSAEAKLSQALGVSDEARSWVKNWLKTKYGVSLN